MAYYAIAVVPVNWESEQVFGFSKIGYELWRDSIEPGTMVLLYKPAPVNAIVAQAETQGKIFLKPEEWPAQNFPEQPMTGLGMKADVVMPLRVLYRWAEESYIPLAVIRASLDGAPFPAGEWMPIDSTVYERLRNWSPNLKTTM